LGKKGEEIKKKRPLHVQLVTGFGKKKTKKKGNNDKKSDFVGL